MSKFFEIRVEKGGKPRLRMHEKASFFWHIVAMFLFLLLSALNMLRCVLHFCVLNVRDSSLLVTLSFPAETMTVCRILCWKIPRLAPCLLVIQVLQLQGSIPIDSYSGVPFFTEVILHRFVRHFGYNRY